SAVAIPASCSFKIAMICSSLNLLRFIPSDSFASDSTQNRSHFRGARQLDWRFDWITLACGTQTLRPDAAVESDDVLQLTLDIEVREDA
ncbi:hypothetical protein HNO88_002103, partial [Novosphingobium chloroacetimidivorans]|nr:hypothetical protein [Novosphingobium chloroacetimidivorans]